MNIREFRNNFCKLALGNEIITVTKRNQIIGVYTPYKKDLCEREKFNGVKCLNTYEKEIKVSYEDKTIEARVCNDCLLKLREEVQVEEL